MRRSTMPYTGSELKVSNLFEGLSNITKLFENELLTNSNVFGGENVNVYVDTDGYHIEMAIPGVNKDEIDVSLADDTIIVNINRKDKKEIKNRNYIFKEFSIENIEREFQIPEGFDLDKLEVKYENGILKFDIPVKKVEYKDIKKIEIK